MKLTKVDYSFKSKITLIDLFHNGGRIKYSSVLMLRSHSSLATTSKFLKNLFTLSTGDPTFLKQMQFTFIYINISLKIRQEDFVECIISKMSRKLEWSF